MNFVDTCDCDKYMFHFNPRPNQGCVVRNANFGGWGEEERDQDEFPFEPGHYFDSVFVATDDGYVVNSDFFPWCLQSHYENKPIQIYRKLYNQKPKIFL